MQYLSLICFLSLTIPYQPAFSSHSDSVEEEKKPIPTMPLAPEASAKDLSQEETQVPRPYYVFTNGCFSLYEGTTPPEENTHEATPEPKKKKEESYVVTHGCFSLKY